VVGRVAYERVEAVVRDPSFVVGVLPPPHAQSAVVEAVAPALGSVDEQQRADSRLGRGGERDLEFPRLVVHRHDDRHHIDPTAG
jgi:hypothetical protein